MDEGEFEFDFFSERPTATEEEERGEALWEEDLPDRHDNGAHEHGAPAPALPPEIIKRRRIAAAVAIALVLLIILIVVVTSGSGGDGGPYRNYLDKVSPIAADSQQAGASLSGALGAKQTASLVAKLDDLVQQTVGDITRLQALAPPLALRSEQEQALAALDLRLRGLQGMRDSLSQALGGSGASWEAVVSGQVDDLITSDVIWDKFVSTPANGVLQANGVGGVFFPQSRFVSDASSLRKSIRTVLQAGGGSTTGPVLTLGATGTDVTSWQTQLNAWLKLTAPTQTPLTVDGTFGATTRTTTQALQTASGLTPDGVVGPSTRQALQRALAGTKPSSAATTAPVIKLGDKSAAVTAWQTQLNTWLKLTAPTQTQLTPDGTFGAATQTATEQLQTAQGLAPDGIVGPATRQALTAALAKARGGAG